MSTIKALVVDDSKIMRSQVKRALDQLMIAEFEYEDIDNIFWRKKTYKWKI